MPKLTIKNMDDYVTTDFHGTTVGKRIAFFRKKRGMSQRELAEKIGIDRSIISNYELDRARVYDEILARLAIALKISSDEIIGLKKSKKKDEEPSLRIMKRLKRIEELPEQQRKHILRTLDSLIRDAEKG